MKRNMKKTLTMAVAYSLVSSMVLAAPAYAEVSGGSTTTGTTNASSSANVKLSFPDVPSSHWAVKHISKLLLEGIVQGDDMGRYNPDSKVSQQDVIIMAIRMMGLESKALENKATISLPWSDVRSDARPYIAYAIDQGLIDLQEEYDAAASKWGTKEAPREWVAKIVVRAIGKKQDAIAKAEFPGTFADNDKISSGSAGYVNEAVSLGIVQGFEDNTFRPADGVTRAQMATFLSRAEKYSPNLSDRALVGTVMAIDGSKLTIRDKNGLTKDVTLHTNASFYTYKNDTTRLTPSDVKLYNEVYVLHQQGTAYLVEVTNDEIPMTGVEGKLVSVDMNELTASIEVDGKYYTYDLASNVSVRDLNGAGLSLGSLQEDSVVELKKHALIQDAKISQIVVKEMPINKTVDAAFLSFDPVNLTVKVKDRQTGAEEAFKVTDKSVFWQGDNYFDPANLFEGDIVRVEVKKSKVVKVEVVQQLVEKRDEGKLLSLSDDKTIVTIQKSGDELASYKASDRVLVVMGDGSFGSIRDLMPGDQLKLEINQNKIDKVTVQSRSIQNFTLATIETYIADSKILLVKDELGNPKSYLVTDKTRFLYDNTELTLANFQSNFVKGKRVNVVASESTLLSVQIATRMEGTVTSVSTTTGELTIKTPTGGYQTYKTLSYTSVDKYSLPSAKLTDLRTGDYVRGFFDGTQQTVVGVSVRETQLVHTISKDASNSRITVKDLAGNTSSYSLSGLPVHRNGQPVSTNDIAVDEPLQITFMGKSIESVQVLDAVRGKVTGVDAVANRVTVTDYTNVSRVFETGTNVSVRNGSTVLPSLASVKPDDRVEMVKDTSGNTTVLIIPGEQRTVQSYDASTKVLNLMRRTVNDKLAYPLHDKAYIHQGTQLIAPTALVSGNVVTVYLINDKIVEIAKP